MWLIILMSKWCFWFFNVGDMSKGKIWLNNGLVLNFLVWSVIWRSDVLRCCGVSFLIWSNKCIILCFFCFLIVKVFLFVFFNKGVKYCMFLGFIFGKFLGTRATLNFCSRFFSGMLKKSVFELYGIGVCMSLCVGVWMGM